MRSVLGKLEFQLDELVGFLPLLDRHAQAFLRVPKLAPDLGQLLLGGLHLLAGSLAAALPRLLALRAVSRWIPPISGAVLVMVGGLSLVSRLS